MSAPEVLHMRYETPSPEDTEEDVDIESEDFTYGVHFGASVGVLKTQRFFYSYV